jgi:outer membrane protein TolC
MFLCARNLICRGVIVCCALTLTLSVQAQQAPLTIGQAVEQALSKYPAVRVSLEQSSAAAAGIDLARTAYLPRADFIGQFSRSTRNNIFGLMLPQSVIPSITGPVLGTDDLTSVWNSATGMLVSWEPFDFGLRKANVGAADSNHRRTEADLTVARFQVSVAAADAFLTLLAAQQAVVSARAGVERARVVDQVVGTLAQSGLRPGADAARAHAEFAFADTQLIRAQEAADQARAALADFLDASSAQITIDSGPLLALPKELPGGPSDLTGHPLARQQSEVVSEAKAQERVLNSTYFPRFLLQGSLFSRGSGARLDGTTGGGFSGLGPNVKNWALSLTIVFPAFDFAAIHARKQIQFHLEQSATAQHDRILDDLRSELEKGQAQLAGARRVAQNTPVALDAARAAEQQATARYKSGLGNIAEVADAQRLLTQAEIDDALARLGVWRALLAVAAAQGDLQPFLQLATK